MTPRRRLAAIAVLGVASFLAFGAATCGSFGSQTTVQNDANGVHGITVSGEGKVQAKPDIAQLVLGVSVLRDTVAQARTDAASSMTAITNAVKADTASPTRTSRRSSSTSRRSTTTRTTGRP